MSIRVLLTSWNAYPAVNPRSGTAVGGSETSAWAFARELARSDRFDVCFGVRVAQPPREQNVEGVRLVPAVLPLLALRNSIEGKVQGSSRFPWVKVKRWSSDLIWKLPVLAAGRLLRGRPDWMKKTYQIVKQLRPDVIVSFGVNDDTAAAFHAARRENLPGLLWLQSNMDVHEKVFMATEQRDVYGVSTAQARSCFENASRILCQSEVQREALRPHVARPISLIAQPVDIHRFSPPVSEGARDHVLWIGRYDQFHKRPLLAVEVAKKCPEIPFLFVINKRFDEVEEQVRRERPENVTLMDYLPHDQMPEAFRRARLFLSTGSREFEGFPNVFLESAASGTPVCSLEDFNQFLETSRAGGGARGSIDELAELVRSFWCDPAQWQACSMRGVSYVREHHALEAVADQVAGILEEMTTSPRDEKPD